MKLQGANTPRPMTHDLISEMLSELDVSCSRVAVTELRENTFYASITLSVNGREVEIDSRPSDALALAVRSGAPIFAAEDALSAALRREVRARWRGDRCVVELEFSTPAEAVETARSIVVQNARRAA